MNKRIAKKIEDVWHVAMHQDFRSALERYSRYRTSTVRTAVLVDARRRKRKAAAVRAKRGWAPRQVALTVPLSRTSVAFGASRPDASWLPNPYCS